MEKKAFKLLHDSELSWWYKGRMRVVAQTLTLLPSTELPLNILDVGAGFGGMFSLFNKYGTVYALEPNQEARTIAKERGYKKVFASIEEIEKEGLSFHLVGAFDVIEHTADDADFIAHLSQLLEKDGVFIATVPAHPWLWSDHDVLHHHHRRYTQRSFRDLFEKAGFFVEYLGHWNMLLLLPAILARVFGISGESSMNPGSFIDRLFTSIVTMEARLIPKVSLPWGVSIVSVAQWRK